MNQFKALMDGNQRPEENSFSHEMDFNYMRLSKRKEIYINYFLCVNRNKHCYLCCIYSFYQRTLNLKVYAYVHMACMHLNWCSTHVFTEGCEQFYICGLYVYFCASPLGVKLDITHAQEQLALLSETTLSDQLFLPGLSILIDYGISFH